MGYRLIEKSGNITLERLGRNKYVASDGTTKIKGNDYWEVRGAFRDLCMKRDIALVKAATAK